MMTLRDAQKMQKQKLRLGLTWDMIHKFGIRSMMTLRDAQKMQKQKLRLGLTWDMIHKFGIGAIDCMNHNSDLTDIVDIWKDETVYCVAGGASARGIDLSVLKGKNVIACNHVIEKFQDVSWFVFQDQRFLRTTTYDIDNFNGKIFCPNNSYYNLDGHKEQVYRYMPIYKGDIDMNPNRGLMYRSLTGTIELHLALISGASKIYLIGHDTPKNWSGESHHIWDDYTGEEKTEKSFNGTLGKLKLYDNFVPYCDRIINVCEDGHLPFQSINKEQFLESLSCN